MIKYYRYLFSRKTRTDRQEFAETTQIIATCVVYDITQREGVDIDKYARACSALDFCSDRRISSIFVEYKIKNRCIISKDLLLSLLASLARPPRLRQNSLKDLLHQKISFASSGGRSVGRYVLSDEGAGE